MYVLEIGVRSMCKRMDQAFIYLFDSSSSSNGFWFYVLLLIWMEKGFLSGGICSKSFIGGENDNKKRKRRNVDENRKPARLVKKEGDNGNEGTQKKTKKKEKKNAHSPSKAQTYR